MENFTPISSLLGGGLLGFAALVLMLFNGRIAGISGIAAGLLSPSRGDSAWRIWFIAGLLIGPFIAALFGAQAPQAFTASPLLLVAAGILVGIGTRLGSGCTSGHGICGMGRLSMRSFVATATFMATALVTVYIMRHVLA